MSGCTVQDTIEIHSLHVGVCFDHNAAGQKLTTLTFMNFSGERISMLKPRTRRQHARRSHCRTYNPICQIIAACCVATSLFWSTHVSLTTGAHRTTGWRDCKILALDSQDPNTSSTKKVGTYSRSLCRLTKEHLPTVLPIIALTTDFVCHYKGALKQSNATFNNTHAKNKSTR